LIGISEWHEVDSELNALSGVTGHAKWRQSLLHTYFPVSCMESVASATFRDAVSKNRTSKELGDIAPLEEFCHNYKFDIFELLV